MALMADLVTVAILARDTGGRVSYSEDNWNKHGKWKWNTVHLMMPTQQQNAAISALWLSMTQTCLHSNTGKTESALKKMVVFFF